MRLRVFTSLVLLLFWITTLAIASKWYESYEKGLREMEKGNWEQAIRYFKEAIKIKNKDTKKIRAYGMRFIEYFPHREMGVAFYHLGNFKMAARHLRLSLKFQYSKRAEEYLRRVLQHIPPPRPELVEKPEVTPRLHKQPPPIRTQPERERKIKLVGERLSVAVLPFRCMGESSYLGELDIQDKIITTLVNQKRFKVFERAQLDKILEEQKLGMMGVVDVTTAAQIGKVIGVDAVMCGSLTLTPYSVSIDARLVDAETAVILTAKDVYSPDVSLGNIKRLIEGLSLKISDDLPLVDGYVIAVEEGKITVDFGRNKGLRRGMKCILYREGEEIKHPITGESLGRKTEELGEIRLIDVFDEYSIAEVVKSKGVPLKVGDRVITK